MENEDKYFPHLSDSINGDRVKPDDPPSQNGHATNGCDDATPECPSHSFIVTHVHPQKKVDQKECLVKKCLDHWQLSFKQTVKWSELANVKNLEIDGVSKLRVRQDRICFEYNLYEESAAKETEEVKAKTRQSEI